MPDSSPDTSVVILISALEEWGNVRSFYNEPAAGTTPFGEFFLSSLSGSPVVFFNGGWGKVSAAAGTQYAIDRWQPDLLINAGTCGGFEGDIAVGEVILASETLIYDIYERMGDQAEAERFYATPIDLASLRHPLPQKVRIERLLSADQDIDPDKVEQLRRQYSTIVADWESGAIAWTARRNGVRVLILRAVSDLVSASGGELYNGGSFTASARSAMLPLLKALPEWVRCALPQG